jgi:hypothetical protein
MIKKPTFPPPSTGKFLVLPHLGKRFGRLGGMGRWANILFEVEGIYWMGEK